MAVSKSTPAATAILAGPRPTRAGTASSTRLVTGSSLSRGSTGPRPRPGTSSPAEREQFHHVPGAGDADRAPFPDDLVTAGGKLRGHRPGHGHQRPVLVASVPGGVERAAAQRRLHHDGAAAERGDHPVADQEAVPGRQPARRPLADGRASLADGAEQVVVALRVVAVHAAGQHGDREAAGGDRATVRTAVDAEGATGDDRPALLGQGNRHVGADMRAVRGRRAGAHDRHRTQAGEAQVDAATHPQPPRLGIAQHVKLAWPARIARAEQLDPLSPPAVQRQLRGCLTEPGGPTRSRPAQREQARAARAALATGPGRLSAAAHGGAGHQSPPGVQGSHDLHRRAVAQQRAHDRIARFGHAGERRPGQPLGIGDAAHRPTPSHRPSA